MRSPSSLLAFLLRRSRWLAGAVLLLTLIALPALRQLRFDNTLEVWLDQYSTAYGEYQEFARIFGSEEFILLIYDLPDPLELPLLERLTDLRFDFEEIEGVRQIYCLSSLYSRFFSLRGLEAFDLDLRGSPFYRHFLISGDGRRAAQWIWLDFDHPDERARIVREVEQVVSRSELAGARLAGSPVLNVALNRASQRSARQLFPWVFGLSALLLLLLFRRLYGVLVPFVAVGIGIVWTLATLVATGHTLNMVTVALAPLVWVLGLSTSIHLVSRCEQLRTEGASLEQARKETLRGLVRPCAYSALTTSLGFASLLVSSMKPVREMGLFAAAGVLFCFICNLLLFPTLASWIRPRPGRRLLWDRGLERLLNLLGDWTRLHPRRILVSLCVLALGLGWGLTRLRAEASVIEFFKADSEIAVVYKQILPDFTGPYSLEITVEPPELDRDTFVELDRLGREVEKMNGIRRVLSTAELLKKVYQMTEGLPPETDLIPTDAEVFERSRAELESRLGREKAAFEDPESGMVRLSALASAMRSEEHSQLVKELEHHLETQVDPSWQPRLTGIVKLLVDLQHQLLYSQIRSFGLAFLIIGPVMAFLLRSRRDALISLVPNLFPILSVLGLMGWIGLPLDPATVMIAGIAFGIAVNDTIHFLVHYRAARRRGESSTDALHTTFHTAGRAMVLTTIVAALGFFVLALAEFIPLIFFGVLTGLTMFAALLGDLLFLPALLGLLDDGSATRDSSHGAASAWRNSSRG